MSIPPSGTPYERLAGFFEFMWADTKGFVYLPYKDRQTGDWKKKAFQWPAAKQGVIEYVLECSATNKDVYFAPTIFNQPRPVKENVLGTHVLWADYDGTATDEWSDMLREAGSEPHSSVPGPPTLRVQSSTATNQHAYWRLKEFATDVSFIETVNRQIAFLTGADPSGWDVNQVLRPIETLNFKYDTPQEVIVFEESRREYLASEFAHFKPIKELIDDSIVIDELPKIEAILGKYVWPNEELELINKSLNELGGADRSSALSRVAYSAAENGLTDTEIYTVLLFCDDKWEKYKNRGDRKRRLIELVNRARQKHPYGENLTFAGLVNEDVKTDTVTRVVYGLQDLLNEEVEIEWMIEGMIEKHGLGILASAPGIGKTQLSLQVAQHCALGTPMLEWKPVKRHKAVFFSNEMNLPSLKSILTTMSEVRTAEELEILQRNFLIVPRGQSLNLMSKEGRKFFQAVIEEHGPNGVYIDSLQTIYPKKLSDDEIREIFDYLVGIRQKYGLYIWLIHHNRKSQESNKKPTNLDDVYGNQAVTAYPDYVGSLWRPKGSTVLEYSTLKNRLAPEPPSFKLTRGPGLTFMKAADDEFRDGSTFSPHDFADGLEL